MLRIEYDGQIIRIDGWLPEGSAAFSIPPGGTIELFTVKGSVGLICRDRHGASKSMRVEARRA